jgi:hypothetical protein
MILTLTKYKWLDEPKIIDNYFPPFPEKIESSKLWVIHCSVDLRVPSLNLGTDNFFNSKLSLNDKN